MPSLTKAACFAACVVLHATAALADDPAALEKATALFDEGLAAEQRGDARAAAQAFAAADAVLPDAAALEAALRASIEAGEPVLAMKLADRAARDPGSAKLSSLAADARQRFGASTGRIVVRCSSCSARIDGAPVARETIEWVAAGSHEVVLSVDGRTDRSVASVAPGALHEIAPVAPIAPVQPPARQERPRPAERGGASPVWFWAGAIATTVAFGATIASGVDTANQHADFSKRRTNAKAGDGLAAETRTNVLLGVSVVAGLSTAAVGLFLVDF